ncbi:MAG: DinB family protein [Candidatus Zixiibacteriota bacterium]|nr:MAG: DinB family protein [candidate division Zixibacteria bacterium]
MFTSIADFEKAWSGESGNTSKMLGALTDASLSQSVAEDHRTLGRMAWHIALTIAEMMPATGLEFKGVDLKAPVPATAAEIKKTYDNAAGQLLEQVKTKWDDAGLQVEDELYGETWKRGFTLAVLLNHEIHHRGQMTVLMRQAGLKVPGIYGPAKEEWVTYGAPEPPV